MVRIGGEKAAKSLVAEVIHLFEALPSCKQEDLLKRLNNLKQTLSARHETAVPLINLISLTPQIAAKMEML